MPIIASAQQKDTGHISVRFVAAGANDFDIRIYKTEKTIKIVYWFCDSTAAAIYPVYQKKDEEAFKLKDKDAVLKAKKELDSLWEANSFYSSDSLEFACHLNQSYSDLLSVMFTAEKCDFENRTPGLIMCDGYAVSTTIQSGSHYLKVGVRSPNNISYPLLTKFLTETVRIGFNSNCASFLSTKTTYIYP
jgi:hypothetical protein